MLFEATSKGKGRETENLSPSGKNLDLGCLFKNLSNVTQTPSASP